MAKAPAWMILYPMTVDGNTATIHFSIKRNLSLWLFIYQYVFGNFKIPFYRYPQALYQVTKCWWNIV